MTEKADEKQFNETFKRMLKTPPKPHDKKLSDKIKSTPKKQSVKNH